MLLGTKNIIIFSLFIPHQSLIDCFKHSFPWSKMASILIILTDKKTNLSRTFYMRITQVHHSRTSTLVYTIAMRWIYVWCWANDDPGTLCVEFIALICPFMQQSLRSIITVMIVAGQNLGAFHFRSRWLLFLGAFLPHWMASVYVSSQYVLTIFTSTRVNSFSAKTLERGWRLWDGKTIIE